MRRSHSPEECAMTCPDNGTAIVINMTLLTDGNRAVHVGTCPTCRDHVTVKANVELTPDEFKEFYMAGVPVFHYGAA